MQRVEGVLLLAQARRPVGGGPHPHVDQPFQQGGQRLAGHLIPFREARAMLREAGCPSSPGEIGIEPDRLRAAYEQAYFIRRRYTILDFARRFGVLGECVGRASGPGGAWPEGEARS